MKISCTLDNPDEFDLIRTKKVLGNWLTNIFMFNNIIKILNCHCKRNRLNQLNVNYRYAYSFDDCRCSGEVFATECNECRYNEVDSIFCCPCFIPNIFESKFHEIKKKLNFRTLCTGDIWRRLLILTILKGKYPCFFVALIIWLRQCIWTLLTVCTTTNLYSIELF